MQSIIFNIGVVAVGVILASAMKCFVDSEDKISFLTRRSKCQNCQTVLRVQDLIPIFSFILRRGRCGYCGEYIPFDVFLYEFFTAFFLIFYFIFYENFIFLNLLHVTILIFLVFLSIEDVTLLEVLDELFYILLILNIVLVVSNFYFFNIIDFLSLICLFHLLYLLGRGGIGYGDIKVFCVLSLNLNLFEGMYLFIFTFLYAGFFVIILFFLKRAKRGVKIPLVPFISMAYLTILLLREGILW